MLETEYSGFGVSTIPGDSLAPKVARASAGMGLSVYDRQLVGLLHCEFGLFLLNKIQSMIRNVNTSLIILKQLHELWIFFPRGH